MFNSVTVTLCPAVTLSPKVSDIVPTDSQPCSLLGLDKARDDPDPVQRRLVQWQLFGLGHTDRGWCGIPDREGAIQNAAGDAEELPDAGVRDGAGVSAVIQLQQRG